VDNVERNGHLLDILVFLTSSSFWNLELSGAVDLVGPVFVFETSILEMWDFSGLELMWISILFCSLDSSDVDRSKAYALDLNHLEIEYLNYSSKAFDDRLWIEI
jgi:hypothetical protein